MYEWLIGSKPISRYLLERTAKHINE